MRSAGIGVPPERVLRTRGSEGLPAGALSPEPPAAAARDRLPYRANHGCGHGSGPIVLFQAARGSPSGNFTVYLERPHDAPAHARALDQQQSVAAIEARVKALLRRELEKRPVASAHYYNDEPEVERVVRVVAF
jgi:selenocysteine lyase/cysteine desulfurase